MAQDANQLFEQGGVAMDAGRFSESRDLFRASLEIDATPGTAFNLAVSLTRTGEFVEAVGLFGRIFAGEYGEISRQQRTEVRSLREEAESRIGTLTIRIPGADGVEIQVDGARYREPLPLDPGEHIVSIRSSRHEPFEERIRLSPGEDQTFRPTLRLRADANLGRLIVEGPDDDTVLTIEDVADGMGRLDLRVEAGTYEVVLAAGDQERRTEVAVEARTTNRYALDFEREGGSPWLWVLGGVLVAGGAAAAIILLTTGEKDPRSDPVYGTIETLRPR